MRAVEDAIARQVLQGGDLPTNLLELSAVREDILLAVVAESHAMPAVPAGRLATPPAYVLRVLPGELALRHGVFPLEINDRTLVLATSEPLGQSVEDDLSFALDVAIELRAALLPRIRQAIGEAYGIPLDRRLHRLVARLEGRPDPSPSEFPPADRSLAPFKMPRPISVPAPTFGTGLPPSTVIPVADYARLPSNPVHTPVVTGDARVPMPSIPQAPALPLHLEPLTPSPTAEVEDASDQPEAPVAAARAEEVPRTQQAAEAPRGPGRGDKERTKALAGVMRSAARQAKAELTKEGRDVRAPKPVRRKGPFTNPMAEDELAEAESADEVFDVLFSFAQQFFAYAALFVVHGDLAEGRAAAGAGAPSTKVSGIGVALDLPSAFSRARELKGPLLGRLSKTGLDAEIAKDLERERAGVAAVLPIVVRTRTVGLLYGDDGEDDVTLGSIGEVVAMIGLASSAIERLVLRRKLGPGATPPPPRVRRSSAPARAASLSSSGLTPPPARAQGVAALARALALPPSATPPPVDVADATDPDLPPADDSDLAREPQPRPQVSPGAESVRTPDFGVLRPTDISPQADDPSSLDIHVQQPEPRRPPPVRHEIVDEDSGENIPKALARLSVHEVRSIGGPDEEPSAAASSGEPLPETVVAIPKRRTAPGMGALSQPPVAPSRPPDPVPWPERRRSLTPSVEEQRIVDLGKPVSPSGAPPPPVDRDKETVVGHRALVDLNSFEDPVAAALLRRRDLSERPIRREEDDEDESPGASAFVAAIDPSPSPPHRFDIPPRSAPRSVPPLPSVIVDVAAEYASLLQKMLVGGPGSQEAFAELVRHGEQAVQVLMAKFPGPLRVDRHRVRDQLPAASQCGPLLELLVAIRRPALPFVTTRTSQPDIEIRFWATHVLGELRYPEAANALVPRLFDDDVAVRRVARRSAASLVSAGEAGAPILQGLEHMVRSPDQPAPYRILAIETMGEIRTGAMVPPLVDVLGAAHDDVAEAARRALLLITRQDFGKDIRRWNDWWARHGGKHRIEWLIDALMHDQPAIRRAAGDELKQLTKEYFGYYDDLPKKERERAHGLYRAWWEKEGRRRFSSFDER